MEIPPAYHGREHTFLKHRVLQLYLEGWGHKLGSIARKAPVRLWYVDCFSGPWKSKDTELRDTSIHIGLECLETAAATWGERGFEIQVSAIFVEHNADAFDELCAFLDRRRGLVRTHPLRGAFGDRVADLKNLLRSDPALLFVDPTGWKGVAMRFIAPLSRPLHRDVIVNVMFDHINRFKDDPRTFIREQMRELFSTEIPSRLSEVELLTLYRDLLKRGSDLKFAADLAVPHPTRARTKFRLVIGGHAPAVLRLFRDVERKVIGAEAATVRTRARDRRRLAQTGQTTLFAPQPPETDPVYAAARREGLRAARAMLSETLSSEPLRYGDLWPRVLEGCHITERDLAREIQRLGRDNALIIEGMSLRDRSLKDQHRLRAGKGIPVTK